MIGSYIILAVALSLAPSNRTTVATVRSVAEALRQTVETCPQARPFEFTGTVLNHLSNLREDLFFTDGSAASEIHMGPSRPDALCRGDRIRVKGQLTVSAENKHLLQAHHVTFLEHTDLPAATETTAERIASGSANYRLSKIRGVIASVIDDDIDPNFGWMSLRTGDRPVIVSVCDRWYDLGKLRALTDAEVEITGMVLPIAGWRQRLGSRITLGEEDSLVVTRPPPEDPFQAQRLVDERQLHRQLESGTVLAVGNGRFFIQTKLARTIAVHPVSGLALPKAGDSVTVVGFAELDPFRIRMTEALFRTDAPGKPIHAHVLPVTARQLFTFGDGQESANVIYNGRLIRTSGLRVPTPDTMNDGDLLQLSSDRHSVFVELSAVRQSLAEIPPNGSLVEVTGLCLAEFETSVPTTIFPRFRRFTVIPCTADEIRIVRAPSWWTPDRLLYTIVFLVSGILAVLVWSLTLKAKSERRGRELYAERIGHALAEQKIEERTRLAVELHDSLSQTLTGVALQLDGGETETAKTMLASCRGELRRCLWDLRCRTFEEKDMTEAVLRTLAPYLNDVETSVRFNVPREQLSESSTHAILRIVRELVVNAIRHGHATGIRIAGEYHDGHISFSVRDNGCGFDPKLAPGPEQGHFGLLGIRERLEDFNGSIDISPSVPRGTKVTITLTT